MKGKCHTVAQLRANQAQVTYAGRVRDLPIPSEFDTMLMRSDGRPDARNEKGIVEAFWSWVRREDRV